MDTIIMPYFEHHPAWASYDAVSGMTFTRFQSSSRLGGGRSGQASDADADDGDSISYYVQLAAGTYSLTFTCTKSSNCGIIEAFLDATSLGTTDAYVAGTTFSAVSTISSITVAADGNYTLKFQINGKNASATDYNLTVEWFSFLRTGA